MLTVHEAVVELSPWESGPAFGFGQAHVHKGFELSEECGGTLAAEKPRWSKLVSPVCHPLGGVLEVEFDVGAGALDLQAVYANGIGGTLEDEYDGNLWLAWSTPLQGLALGGFYNPMEIELNPASDGTEEASRWGGGIDYSAGGFLGRAEYTAIDGVTSAFRLPDCGEDPEDIENSAILLQGGYRIATGSDRMPALTPYISWQRWDRWSNAPSGDWAFQWVTGGVKLDLPAECYAAVEYMSPAGTPEGLRKDAAILTTRLGALF